MRTCKVKCRLYPCLFVSQTKVELSTVPLGNLRLKALENMSREFEKKKRCFTFLVPRTETISTASYILERRTLKRLINNNHNPGFYARNLTYKSSCKDLTSMLNMKHASKVWVIHNRSTSNNAYNFTETTSNRRRWDTMRQANWMHILNVKPLGPVK